MDVSDEALLDIDLLADDASEDDGDGEAPPSSGPASTPTSSTSSPPQGVEEPASPHSGWRGVLGATGSFFGNITSGLFGRLPYGLESKRGIGRKKREAKHPKDGKVVRRYRAGPAGRGAKRYRPSRDDSLEDLFDDDDLAMPAPEEAPFYPEKWPGKVCALCNLSERTQLGQGEMRQFECKASATPTTTPETLGMIVSPKSNEFSTPVSLEDPSVLQQPLPLSRRTKGPNKNKTTPLYNIEHTDELSIIGHSELLDFSALVENNITYLHKACIDWSPPFEDVAVHAESSFSRPNHDDIGDNAIDNFPSEKSSLEEVRIRGILTSSLLRKCGFCNKYGASISCKMSCSKYFHFPCVLASGGFLDFSTKSAFCKEHLYQTPLVCTSDIVCRNCGVVGDLANLMTCVSCGCHYHGTCVGLAQLPGVRAGWACRSCRVCQVCHGSDSGHGPTEGRTVSCEQCDKLYHALCVRPAMTSVPKYGWKCKCCRMCTDCGARSPGAGLSSRWHAHYTVCDSCYQQRNKGSSCPLCKRAYRLAAQRDMVRCYGCKRYVHGTCDPDADLPNYNAKKLIQPDYEYLCPSCKAMGPAFFKRKDSLDDETISMSQESSVGDDSFLEQDPLVLDPRPDVGLGKGKPYTASSKICKLRMAGYKKGGIVTGKLSMLKRQRSGLIDFSRKRGPKTKMRGMFGVPGLGLQRPQLPDIKGGADEEPGVENKLVLCSSKDKFVLTQDICVMCGAIGTDSEGCLIACTQCGQMYHPYCVNVKIGTAVVQLGWRCIDCVACEGCGRRGDEGLLLMCEDCDVSWHTYCAVPPLTGVPQGAWRCPRCRRCRSCGITESGCAAWGQGYAECGQCASAITCCLCSESYCEGDLVIQCGACSRWLHGTCDTIVDETDAEECCSSGYECPLCRPRDRAAPHVLRKRIEAEHAAAAPPPAPPPVPPPAPQPISLPVLTPVPEPDTDHYYDGICLSSTGMRMMKELEATLALESKRKQRRSKNSDPSQDKDNVVLGSEADMGGFNVKPEGFDAPPEGVFVFKEGMVWNVSTDGPPPEGFNTFTSESGVCMLRRKRQRNLHKLGIGGFSVKTRNPAKLYDDEKDSIVPDITNLSESPGTKRKVRRKPKSRLAESFPSYMQEAFFGRELLDPPRSDSTTPTLGMTANTPLMPPAPSSISADSCESDDDGLISIDFLDGSDSAANIELNPEEADLVLSVKPKEEKVEVEKLSDSLSIDKTLNNMKMEVDTIKSEDTEKDVKLGQPTLPHTGDVNQFDKNMTSNSSDSDIIDNKPMLQNSMSNDMAQSTRELSPKDDMSLIGVNLDVMVRESLPNMDSQDVEDIFKGVLTDDSQESQESSISYVNSISSSGGYNQQRQQLTSPMEYASPYHTEYSGNSQLSPAFSEGSGVWSTNMAGVPGPLVIGSGSESQPIVQGQLPLHPAPPPATYNQRSTDKMRADESLGAAATISAVLYANLTHPEWRTEFPTWSERCKQILKRWRALPQEEKAPYLQRARDNRSAIRMKKAQQMSAAGELQQPATSETTAVAETAPGPVSPQLQSSRAAPSPAQLPEVPAEDKDGLASPPIPLRQIPAPRARHSPAPNVTVNPFGALEPAPRRSPPTDHHIRVLTPSEIMRTLPCLPRALRDATTPVAGTSPTHDVAAPDAERGAAVRSAREAEQERQWKNLQQMRQQQAQQQQQIIHDQRMQAVADNKDPQRCLFTYSNSMARVQRQTSTSPNSPYPEQSEVASLSPINNNPPGMAIGPSVVAINSGVVMGQGPSPELNRQLRDLLQRHHQPPKIWSMHGVSSEDEQQNQQNTVQSQHLQSSMSGRVGLPGEEPQFRQPLPPGVRPTRPAPPANLQHPQYLLRHHQPGLLAVQQQVSQMQPRMPAAMQNVPQQHMVRGEVSQPPNSVTSEKNTTEKTNHGPHSTQNNEEMAEMDIDKLEQDNANMAEVGDILGGLGGEDDEELLVSLTAEMGDDFNILEYADPELDAFTDADTSHILDGLELADETPGALHCKREIDEETPPRKPEIKIEQGINKAEKRIEPEIKTIKTELEIKTETVSDCQPADNMSQHEQLDTGNSVQQMNIENLVSSQQSVVRLQQAFRPNVVHQQIHHQILKHQQAVRQIEQLNRPTQLNINTQMTSADQAMGSAAQQIPTQMTSTPQQIRPQFSQQIQQQVGGAPSASTVQQQMAATVALALARGRPMAAGTRLVSPDGAVGVVRRDHTVALTYAPRPRPPPLPPPPPPYPGTPPQRLAPPQPPPPYPHQMSAEEKEGWSEWLRGPRPLLLQEQPLLLEELLEQEKRELEAGGVVSSGSVTPSSLISPVPGIIGPASQGLTPPIGPQSIVGSPAVADPPPVPAFLTTTLPAPPPPPAVIATDADRQAQLLYEQWLQQQNAIITHQLKHYETEVQKLRKIRKSLNSKQRQLRKSGNELSPNDAAELRRISAEQSTLQKHLEAARKQCRQHGMLMQEYRNKQQQQPTQQIDSPISQSGPPQSPIFSRQNSIPQFQSQINTNRPQQQVQQTGGLQMQSQLSQQMSQIQINNLNQQQHSQLSQQLHLGQHINQNNQQLRLNRQSPLLQQSMNPQGHQQTTQQTQSPLSHQQHSGEQSIIQGQQNQDANQQMHIQTQQMRLQAEINQQQILSQQQQNSIEQQQQQMNHQVIQQMQLNHMQTQMTQQQVHMSPQQVHMSPQHQVHMSPQQQIHMSPHHQQQQQVQMSPQHQQVQMSPQHALAQGGQGKPQVQMSPQHPHQQLQLNLQHSQLISQQQMMMNQQQQMISPQHQQQHIPLNPQMGHNQMQTSPQLIHHQVQMSPQMSHQQISFQRTSPMLGGASPSAGRSITPAPLHAPSPSHSPQLVGNQSPHAEFSPGSGSGSGGRSPFPRPAASRSPLSARFARPPPATQHHHQQGMRVGIPFSGRQTSPLGSPQPLMSPGGVCEPSRQQLLQRQQYSPMGAPGSPLARSPHPVARTPTPSTPGASPADSPVPDLPHMTAHLSSYEQGGGGGNSSLVPAPFEMRRPRYVRLGLFGGAPPPLWPPQTTSIQKLTSDSDIGQSAKPRRESHISKVSILKKKPQYKSTIAITTSLPASFPKGKSVNNAEFTEIDDSSSTPPLSPTRRKSETRCEMDKIKTSQHIKSLMHNTGLTIKSLPGKKLPQVDEPSQNSDDDIVLIDSSPDEKSQILDYDDENDKNFVGAEVSLCAAAQGDSDHGELSVIEPFVSEMGDITESPLDSQEYVLFSSDGVVDYTVDSDDSMKQLSFIQKEDGMVIGYNRHVSESNGEDVHMPSESEDDVIIDRALNEKILQSPTRLEEMQGNIEDDDDDDDDIEETLDDSEIVVIDPNVISPEEHIATEEDFEELIDSRKPEDGSEGNDEDAFNKQPTESIETIKSAIIMPEQAPMTTITRTETTKKTVAVISLATKSQQPSMHHLKIVKTGHNPTSIARLPVISATVLSPHSNTKILNDVSQATVASVSIANQTISVPVLKGLNVPLVPLSNNQSQIIPTSSHMHKIPMSISTPSVNIPISKPLSSVISVISSNVNVPRVASLSPVITLATSNATSSPRIPIPILSHHQIKQKIVKTIEKPATLSLSTSKLSSLIVSQDTTLPTKIFQDEITSPDILQCPNENNELNKLGPISKREDNINSIKHPTIQSKASFICDKIISGKASLVAHKKGEFGTILKHDIDIEKEITRHTELPPNVPNTDIKSCSVLSRSSMTKSPERISEKIPDKIMEGDEEEKSVKVGFRGEPFKLQQKELDKECISSCSSKIELLTMKTIKAIANQTKDMVLDSNMQITSDVSQESVQISIPSPTPSQEQYLDHITLQAHSDALAEVGVPTTKPVESFEEMLNILENITNEPKMFPLKMDEAKSDLKCVQDKTMNHSGNVNSAVKETIKMNLEKHHLQKNDESQKSKIPIHVIMRSQESAQSQISVSTSHHTTMVPQLSPLSQPTELTSTMANVSQQLRTIMSSLSTSKIDTTDKGIPNKHSVQSDSSSSAQVNYENLLPSTKVEIAVSRSSPVIKQAERVPECSTPPICIPITTVNATHSGNIVMNPNNRNLQSSIVHLGKHSPLTSIIANSSAITTATTAGLVVQTNKHVDLIASSAQLPQLTQVIQMPALSKIQSSSSQHVVSTVIQAGATIVNTTPVLQKTQLVSTNILSTTLLQSKRHIGSGTLQLPQQAVSSSQPPALIMTSRPGSIITSSQEHINIRHQNLMAVSKSFNTIVSNPTTLLHSQLTSPLKRSKSTDDPKSDAIGGHIQPAKRHSLESLIVKTEPMETDDIPGVATNIIASEPLSGCKLYSIGTPAKSEDSQNVLLKQLLQNSGSCASVIPQRSNLISHQRTAPSMGIVPSLEAQLARPSIPPPALPVSQINDDSPKQIPRQLVSLETSFISKPACTSTTISLTNVCNQTTTQSLMDVRKTPAKAQIKEESQITPTTSPSKLQFPLHTQVEVKKETVQPLQSPVIQTFNHQDIKKELLDETSQQSGTSGISAASDQKIDIKEELSDIANTLKSIADSENSAAAAAQAKKRKRQEYQKKRKQMQNNSKIEATSTKKKPRKGSKIEEDYDTFIDNLMVQLRQLPPMQIQEPILSQNFGVCPVYGSGDLSKLKSKDYDVRCGDLIGEFGKARIPNVADHYNTKPFGDEDPLPDKPLSSTQRGFYDQEFSPIRFDDESDDKKLELLCKERDTDTPDTIISSSSPECIGADDLYRFPGLKLIDIDNDADNYDTDTESNIRFSPVIPLIAPVPVRIKPLSPYNKDVDKDKAQSNFIGDNVSIKSKIDSPGSCDSGDNVTVTLTLTSGAAEDILGVLRELAGILHIPPPTAYHIVERTATPPSHKLGLYRSKGRDGKEGMPIDIQSILNGAAKFCRHCDVVILDNVIRAKASEFPLLSSLKPAGDEMIADTDADLFFCSTQCYDRFAWRPTNIIMDNKSSKDYNNDKDVQSLDDKKDEFDTASTESMETDELDIKPDIKDEKMALSFIDSLDNDDLLKDVGDDVTNLPLDEEMKSIDSDSETRGLKHCTRDELEGTPLRKQLRGLQYKYWSPGCITPPTKYKRPNERELTELVFRTGVAVMPTKPVEDLRRCALCGIQGDGVADGPSRLLNCDLDRWVHLNCALWSENVYETISGALMNVEMALAAGTNADCSFCHRIGATVRCFKTRCSNIYHLSCAVKDSCVFHKNKTTFCSNHLPKGEKDNELTTLSVQRRVYINRDEHRQVASVMQHSDMNYLIRVGSLIFLSVGHLLPHQLAAFHTPNYIYPVGYKIMRFYWSMRRANARCRYVCSIADSGGRPEFRISALEEGGSEGEEVEMRAPTARAAWARLLDALAVLRESMPPGALKLWPQYVTGEDLFGLTEPAVVRVLESLPGVDTLTDYRFKYGRSPLLEAPLAVNPSGAARSEPRGRAATHWRRPQRTAPVVHGAFSSFHSASAFHHGTVPSQMEPACPYTKQFVHSKSSQYKKMKQEWRNNVYLARSKIQGLGLYAARDLEKHTMVIEYIGEVIRHELSEMREKQYEAKNRGVYMFRLDERRVIDATLSGGLARYINHSCAPNCVAEAVEVDRNLRIIIFAKRRISRGEELAYDYKFDIEDDAHKIMCMCGAPNCRKWMN